MFSIKLRLREVQSDNSAAEILGEERVAFRKRLD